MREKTTKWYEIADIALRELYDIEEIDSIVDTAIKELIKWTYSGDVISAKKADEKLSEIAEWISGYDRRGEE